MYKYPVWSGSCILHQYQFLVLSLLRTLVFIQIWNIPKSYLTQDLSICTSFWISLQLTLPKKTNQHSSFSNHLKGNWLSSSHGRNCLPFINIHSLFWTIFLRHVAKWNGRRSDVCHFGNKTLRNSVPPTACFFLTLNWCNKQSPENCRTTWKFACWGLNGGEPHPKRIFSLDC